MARETLDQLENQSTHNLQNKLETLLKDRKNLDVESCRDYIYQFVAEFAYNLYGENNSVKYIFDQTVNPDLIFPRFIFRDEVPLTQLNFSKNNLNNHINILAANIIKPKPTFVELPLTIDKYDMDKRNTEYILSSTRLIITLSKEKKFNCQIITTD